KRLIVCAVETADVLDGFVVTVYQDATGAVTLPTGVDDRMTSVLNERFMIEEYPEGGNVKWTRPPEVFSAASSSVAYDPVSHLITVTIMVNSDGGGCESTINGVLENIPMSANCPISSNPLSIAFDPMKVPISSPIDADGFAYDITKF